MEIAIAGKRLSADLANAADPAAGAGLRNRCRIGGLRSGNSRHFAKRETDAQQEAREAIRGPAGTGAATNCRNPLMPSSIAPGWRSVSACPMGVEPWLYKQRLNLMALLVFAAAMGFGRSFIFCWPPPEE